MISILSTLTTFIIGGSTCYSLAAVCNYYILEGFSDSLRFPDRRSGFESSLERSTGVSLLLFRTPSAFLYKDLSFSLVDHVSFLSLRYTPIQHLLTCCVCISARPNSERGFPAERSVVNHMSEFYSIPVTIFLKLILSR